MREVSNHAALSMSDSTVAVSSKYTQDLPVQIVVFTFSCKWCLCFYFWTVIWSYIVDLFAGLHELASASSRTLLKLASSVRALLKPYGDTLNQVRDLRGQTIDSFKRIAKGFRPAINIMPAFSSPVDPLIHSV